MSHRFWLAFWATLASLNVASVVFYAMGGYRDLAATGAGLAVFCAASFLANLFEKGPDAL